MISFGPKRRQREMSSNVSYLGFFELHLTEFNIIIFVFQLGILCDNFLHWGNHNDHGAPLEKEPIRWRRTWRTNLRQVFDCSIFILSLVIVFNSVNVGSLRRNTRVLSVVEERTEQRSSFSYRKDLLVYKFY